jgi:hypothetical protein
MDTHPDCISMTPPVERPTTKAFSMRWPALLFLAVCGGCQQDSASVHRLPAPSFDPPTVRGVARWPETTPISRPPPTRPVSPLAVRREWMPPVPARPWRFIVIHHSATARGSAKAFDRSHRHRGWAGLGYHFVIGNGTDTADGLVEVGPRWTAQQRGAHAGVDLYNEQGIGICLVGDFNKDRPSKAQLQSLAELVAHLMREHAILPRQVLGHRDCKPTDCPGRNVDMDVVREMARRVFAMSRSDRQS